MKDDAATRGTDATRVRRSGLLLLVVTAILVPITLLLPRISQDPSYHLFADQRSWLGIPNAADVLSNLPFLAVGLIGLFDLRRLRCHRATLSVDPLLASRCVLFLGVLLTAFSSSYYHLAPSNDRLIFDRLPMTLAFAAFLAWLLGDRLGPRLAIRLLPVFVVLGAASVLWWHRTELQGQGDLRSYALAQFLPLLLAIILLFRGPAAHGGTREIILGLGCYALAKVAEHFDREILQAGGFVSGHTLKHLLAGLGCLHLRAATIARTLPSAPATAPAEAAFAPGGILKLDLFGRIRKGVLTPPGQPPIEAVEREVGSAAWCVRPFAALLARREARALRRLLAVSGVPKLLRSERGRLLRSYFPGTPLDAAAPPSLDWFRAARNLLYRIHAHGVTHNDTHKAANWIVQNDGAAALVDFQLGSLHATRSRWFRLCALEDIRHLLKHQRRYFPASITLRHRALLARRSFVAAAWRRSVKPVYRFVTRRLLFWRDGEGRGR